MEHSLIFHLHLKSVRLKARFNFLVIEAKYIISLCGWANPKTGKPQAYIAIKGKVTHQVFSILQRCLHLHILDESQATGFCLCFHFMGSMWSPVLPSFSNIFLSITDASFPLFFFGVFFVMCLLSVCVPDWLSQPSRCSDGHLQPALPTLHPPCARMTWLLPPAGTAPELQPSLCHLVSLWDWAL